MQHTALESRYTGYSGETIKVRRLQVQGLTSISKGQAQEVNGHIKAPGEQLRERLLHKYKSNAEAFSQAVFKALGPGRKYK
jgi:hypothetical protein